MKKNLTMIFAAGIACVCCTSAATAQDTHYPGADFFKNCAFVCVDIQEGTRPTEVTQVDVPKLWKSMGITAEDVNAANKFAWDIAFPNAVKIADACRQQKIPRIFIHWGYKFDDAMDLDPEIRQSFVKEHGPDTSKWPHHESRADSKPAAAFNVQKDDYVLAKSAQDAFKSCNIEFVLRNLGVKHIIFVGGHTEACLGKTAKSAKRLGFKTLCVEDATNNARESTRKKGIVDSQFDYVVKTEELLSLLKNLENAQ